MGSYGQTAGCGLTSAGGRQGPRVILLEPLRERRRPERSPGLRLDVREPHLCALLDDAVMHEQPGQLLPRAVEYCRVWQRCRIPRGQIAVFEQLPPER